MCEPAFELRVASHDLKPAETYHQLCQSLQLLSEACDVLFDTIGKRVESERQKLGRLASRIQSAQARVEEIAGSSKATTILSSSKYPAPSPGLADHSSLFQPPSEKRRSRTLPPPPPNGDWKSAPRGSEEALELFSFFTSTAHEPVLRQNQPTVDLGSLPAGVRSVADLMLFNSDELPHYKYNVVDNLAGGGYGSPRREGRAAAADSLLPPPTSIFDSQPLRGGISDEFGFRPTLGDVPSFSLPPTLPDLPMAADISWSGALGSRDELPSIAPSAGGTLRSPSKPAPPSSPAPKPLLPQSPPTPLPTKPPSPPPQLSHSNTPNQTPPQAPTRPATPTTPPPCLPPQTLIPKSETPPPPPIWPASPMLPASPLPGPVPSLQGAPEPKLPILSASPGIRSLPPPPPPPPPPLPPPLSAKVASAATTRERLDSSVAALPQLDSVRAALLASIRKPSINLRKTGKGGEGDDKARPTLDRRGTAPPLRSGQPGGGDIFSEMASSLKMRRLSMQGSTVGAPQGGGKSGLPSVPDDEASASGSGRHLAPDESEPLQMPIKSLRDYITRKDAAESDEDDDWEDD